MASLKQDFPLMFIADAFTDKPFSGNPAAVCLVGKQELSDEVYENIAAEMNLPTTAFLVQLSLDESHSYSKGSHFKLRWFTPKCEIPLCGHATMGSAAVLFYSIGNPHDSITFDTLSGQLIARREGSFIHLDLPQNPCSSVYEKKEGLKEFVKAVIGDLPTQDIQHAVNTKLLIRLQDSVERKDLEDIKPDFSAMLTAPTGGIDICGVAVTLKGSSVNGCQDSNGCQYDFVSRYFLPWLGIPEDPVTGAAHTVLACYWSSQLGKKELYARQCSTRGGDLKIRITDGGRVDVAGRAVIALEGKLKT